MTTYGSERGQAAASDHSCALFQELIKILHRAEQQIDIASTQIVETRPTDKTITVIGDKAYVTRDEATKQITLSDGRKPCRPAGAHLV